MNYLEHSICISLSPDEKLCKNKLCKSIHGFMNNSFYKQFFFLKKFLYLAKKTKYWAAHHIVSEILNAKFWNFKIFLPIRIILVCSFVPVFFLSKQFDWLLICEKFELLIKLMNCLLLQSSNHIFRIFTKESSKDKLSWLLRVQLFSWTP